MQFYINTHEHYCGIDLHAKTMYLCILDGKGEVQLHKNFRSRPEDFLEAVAPYRDDLVVGVECMSDRCWVQARSLKPVARNESWRRGRSDALKVNAAKEGRRKGRSLPVDNRGPDRC